MTNEVIKKYIVTDEFGEETITTGVAKSEVLADLQRMGVLEGATVREIGEEAVVSPSQERRFTPEVTVKDDIIFTVPGTEIKILNRNGVLYGQKWISCTHEEICDRLSIQNIKINESNDIELLDWVELDENK